MSLHIDGVRVDKERCGGDEGVEEFLCKCALHIYTATGYRVELAVKRHFCFRELLINMGNGSHADIEELLIKRGNCIYAALFHLRVERAEIPGLVALSNPVNSATSKNGFRSYREVSRDLGIQLSPTIARNVEETKKYLLHLEGDGNPHCVGIEYINDSKIIVYDLKLVYSMSLSEFVTALYSAMDESTAILFEIGCEAPVEMERFLDCFAGAGSSDDVETINLFAINVADDSAEEEIDAVQLCDDGASVHVS